MESAMRCAAASDSAPVTSTSDQLLRTFAVAHDLQREIEQHAVELFAEFGEPLVARPS